MRTHMKTAAGALGAALFTTATLGLPTDANAQNEPEWRSVLGTAVCIFGNQRRVQPDIVVRNARSRGYTNIRNVRHQTQGNVKIGGCGYYEANAELNGRGFLLYARESDGQIVGRKSLGQIARRDRKDRAEMDEKQIADSLAGRGYRGVNSVRYITRPDGDYYRARGLKDGTWYRLTIDDTDGRIIHRRESTRWQDDGNRAELNPEDIRHLLRGQGYRRIADIDYKERGGRDFYTAQGRKDGQWYRLVVSDFTGEVARARASTNPGRRDRIDRAELNEDQIRDKLEEQGYGRIRSVRYMKNDQGDHYEARASAGGNRYLLFVDDSTGQVLNREAARRSFTRDLGNRAEMNDGEVRDFVLSKGYNRIEAVRYISRYGSDWYEVRARRGNAWQTLIVTDHKPKIVARF